MDYEQQTFKIKFLNFQHIQTNYIIAPSGIKLISAAINSLTGTISYN